MDKWFIKNVEGDYKKIAKRFGISNFIAKLLVNREIKDNKTIDSYLNPSLDKLHDFRLLKDLDRAVKIIKESIVKGERIRIVGDYDVDGIMSIYILYMALKNLGAQVDYVIPNRVEEGYGINKDIIRRAKDEEIDLIITCDNGIAALEEMVLAEELGLKAIITDHHEPVLMKDEQLLPKAYAIINPKQADCAYPFKYLCGGAIAYKLIEGLYSYYGHPPQSVHYLLEYVAIATVCDVVDLIDENRIMVTEGLRLLNSSSNPGLRALIKETGIENKEIGVYHLGFILGPTLNASGRLDTALRALDLLLTDNSHEASLIARELKELNDKRKEMTLTSVARIIEEIDGSPIREDKVLLIFDQDTHESIAGIVASRIKERYNKPTIILTQGIEGVKGSARSIEEYNMFEELSLCKDLLLRFGGHPMAAGLSLEYDKINQLRSLLNKNTNLSQEDLCKKTYIDMQLAIDYISFPLIKELELLEPFGKGNGKPIFGDKNLKIVRGFILGKNKNVLKLLLESKEKRTMEALYFGDVEVFMKDIMDFEGGNLPNLFEGKNESTRIDILYYPTINEYNNNLNLQVIIQAYRLSQI